MTLLEFCRVCDSCTMLQIRNQDNKLICSLKYVYPDEVVDKLYNISDEHLHSCITHIQAIDRNVMKLTIWEVRPCHD